MKRKFGRLLNEDMKGAAMSDRELLEKAAKAAGIPWVDGAPSRMGWATWNPLEDDGDALRLAVGLNIEIVPQRVWIWATNPALHNTIKEPPGADRLAATRRAIVRAAAALAVDENGRPNLSHTRR